MACDRYAALLRDVALGVPAPPELEVHLAGCPACRAGLESERLLARTVDGVLQAGLSQEPPPELAVRIRRELERRAAPAPRTPRLWLAAVAATLLAALGLLLARPVRQTPATDTAAVARPSAAPTASSPDQAPQVDAFPRVVIHRRPVVTQRPRATPSPAEPEVIVPPGQEAALWRFTAGLRDRWVEPRAIVLTTPSGDFARAEGAPDSPVLESPPVSLNIDPEQRSEP